MTLEELQQIENQKQMIAEQMRAARQIEQTSTERTARKSRHYQPPPGPMPTLGQIAKQDGGWVWLTCPSPLCLHRVAAHLTIFVQQLGADISMDRFRAKLWCTMCGRLNCSTYAPSWQGSFEQTEVFPEAQGYYAHLEKLDRSGQLRHIVVDRRSGALRKERLTAAQARNAAKRYNNGTMEGPFAAMHFDQWRMAVAQRQS